MAPYIIGGILAFILFVVIANHVAKFMKGKIVLHLTRNAASSGESLTGQVDLTVKKATRGFLKVTLVGQEERRKTNDDDREQEHNTEWVEIYRQDQVLEETRDFPAGFTQSYQLEIIAPSAAEVRQGGAALHDVAESLGEGLMSSVMKMAAGAADMIQRPIQWHVEARLDVTGVDLCATRKASVNLMTD